MLRSTFTYTPGGYTIGKPVTLPLGRDFSIGREGACLDVCLERAVANDCPLTVQILIRTTGDVVVWSVEFSGRDANTYWHFGAPSLPAGKSDPGWRPTPGQLATLERMWLGLYPLPGGLGGALGKPVAVWAFAGQTATEIAAKHGVPTPVLNAS